MAKRVHTCNGRQAPGFGIRCIHQAVIRTADCLAGGWPDRAKPNMLNVVCQGWHGYCSKVTKEHHVLQSIATGNVFGA